jgi:hypothetical protein
MKITKEFKKILDETDYLFKFKVNKPELDLIKSQLKLAYIQGVLDYLETKIKK